jgi:repressor LexA
MKSPMRLTRRQQSIYDYLLEQEQQKLPPLSLDELCHRLGLKSRGSLYKHVHALIASGLVEPMNRKQRGIHLVRQVVVSENELPLLGYIAAGRPIEAIETPEAVEVPSSLCTNRPCYVLQVKGNSMIEDGILDGDWVVVERRDTALNNEIVVALVDGVEATLKRIVQRPGEVILNPANNAMEPIRYPPERVQIRGVVVGQMRSYR